MPFRTSQRSLSCATFTEELAIRGTHSSYAKSGFSCFKDTFVQAESSVFRIVFSAKIPALRLAENRWAVIRFAP